MNNILYTQTVKVYKNGVFREINFIDLRQDDVFIASQDSEDVLIKSISVVTLPLELMKDVFKGQDIFKVVGYPYFTRKSAFVTDGVPTVDVIHYDFK